MLKELVEAHEAICRMGRPLIPRFQELHDEVSADLLIKRLTFHEKASWMLRSHLVAVEK
jgi:starvation-inducible DNA-binding protein